MGSITFSFEKETKGAVRYQEINPTTGAPLDADTAIVGTLYFRKAGFAKVSATWASEGKPPARITITVAE
jgi:hypothetical protein